MCSEAIIKYHTTPQLKCVQTLPCEMFVLKNVHAPELSGANCYAKLSHSKQLLKNIHSSNDVSTILLSYEKIFTVLKPKIKESPTVRNCSNREERRRDKTLAHTVSVQTVTDGISRRVTSGRENTSLILFNHGVEVIGGLLS